MVNYNLTNLTTSLTVSDVVKAGNEFSGGVLVVSFMIAVFFVVVMVLKRGTDLVSALAVAGWSCFLVGVTLAYAGLLSLYAVLLFLAIAGFSSLVLYVQQN